MSFIPGSPKEKKKPLRKLASMIHEKPDELNYIDKEEATQLD
jgi:hypothetical protein